MPITPTKEAEGNTSVCQINPNMENTQTVLTAEEGSMIQSMKRGPFNPFNRNVENHDAPCVVCYVRSRGTQLMIPARNDCPHGWTKEYHGYLMTQHYGYTRANFICVDQEPESVPGSHRNHDGALLYLVQADCGYLSTCPPYYQGRELTCAVCTK